MHFSKILLASAVCAAFLLASGCGDSESRAPAQSIASYNEEMDADWGYAGGGEASKVAAAEYPADAADDVYDEPATRNTSVTLPSETTTIDRKIIYNASLELIVDDFEGVEAKVAEIVKKHGGFIASSNIRGRSGEPRNGHFVIRVPSTNFDDFMSGAEDVGDVRRRSTDSQEVTAEFVDLQSRIRNKQTEEERLIQLLKQATGKLEEVLKVEKELARVRGEIERMQGRLRMLNDLTSLATVTLDIEEIKEYVPDEDEAPGFGTRIARSFGGSVGGIVDVFQGFVVGIAGMIPWLIVITVPVYFLYRYARRHNFWRPQQPRV